MHAIFISYRQDGSRGWATYLHELFQRTFGSNHVFLDNESIGAGNWEEQLEAALGQCRAFVLIIGAHWLQAKGPDGQPRLLDPADVHRGEIEAALLCERVTVIPVLVDGARMPAQSELPASIASLALRQALDLPGGGWRGASSRKRLLEEISRATELVPLPPPPTLPRWHEGWWSAAKTVAAVLVATLLSSIASVVICDVAFGVTLLEPDVSVLALGLLGAWSALAWWLRRRVHLPPGKGHA